MLNFLKSVFSGIFIKKFFWVAPAAFRLAGSIPPTPLCKLFYYYIHHIINILYVCVVRYTSIKSFI